MRRRRQPARALHNCELRSHIAMMLSQIRFERGYFAEHAADYAQAYLLQREEELYAEVTFLTWLGWGIAKRQCPGGCPFSLLGRN